MKVAVKNISNNITQDEMDAGRLQSVFDITVEDGSKVTSQNRSANRRVDLVRDAVASSRANRRQAYGSRRHVGKRRPMAGMKHSVEWWGKGRGVSRIMRRTGQRRAAQNPHTLVVAVLTDRRSRRTGPASSTPSNDAWLVMLHCPQPSIWNWSCSWSPTR